MNVPIDDETFLSNRERAIDYLNARPRLYEVDAYVLTRAIIAAIHRGELANVEAAPDEFFRVAVPKSCPGIPQEILTPGHAWHDEVAYAATAKKLAGLFRDSFEKYADGASEELGAAGPAC